jgi:hypothetical protein
MALIHDCYLSLHPLYFVIHHEVICNVFLQPLAQWLEELETVSQQVSASVTDVTLARYQKAEVLLHSASLQYSACRGFRKNAVLLPELP